MNANILTRIIILYKNFKKLTSLYVTKSERDKFLKNFGKRVSEIRKKKNLSQEELAYEADIDLSSLSRMERGLYNPSICKLNDIATVLNVSVKDFFEKK